MLCKKSNYLKHINRKNPCILMDNNIIIYKCEKCNKEFNHKTSYLYHINKINSCNDINLQAKCNKLEIELFNLKTQNELLIKEKNNTKELENKLSEVEKENSIKENKLKENNKELENKNKELKTENNIFKGENNTLKELLNNKDIQIKDLYKNIYNKTKDNDIKIKIIQEYIYILRECDFVRLNEDILAAEAACQHQREDAEAPPGADDIYKIGRTSKTNPEDRFQKYRSKANYENEVFIISRN
jgi:hypothetical protein